MADEHTGTMPVEQEPSGRIGEELDIEFWTLLEESRILQAG